MSDIDYQRDYVAMTQWACRHNFGWIYNPAHSAVVCNGCGLEKPEQEVRQREDGWRPIQRYSNRPDWA